MVEHLLAKEDVASSSLVVPDVLAATANVPPFTATVLVVAPIANVPPVDVSVPPLTATDVSVTVPVTPTAPFVTSRLPVNVPVIVELEAPVSLVKFAVRF